MKTKNKKNTRVYILATVLIMLISVACGIYLIKMNSGKRSNIEKITVKNSQINKSVTENKIEPTITSISITGAYVILPNIFDSGGTCTIHFSLNGRSFIRSSKSFRNVSYSQCAPIVFSRLDFPISGYWNYYVTYNSTANVIYNSKPLILEVN